MAFVDLTLTSGGGFNPGFISVDDVNGRAFVLYSDYKQMSVVNIVPASGGESETLHATINFPVGDAANSNLSVGAPYTAASDGFVYVLGQITFSDGIFVNNQRLYKVDPSTLTVVGSEAIPFTAGTPEGISSSTVGGNTLIAVVYSDSSNNAQMIVYKPSLPGAFGSIGATAGVVGTTNMGSISTTFSELIAYPIWDTNTGNIWMVSDDSGFPATSYLTRVNAPGYTTNTQFTIPPDGVNFLAAYNAIFDAGSNSLQVLFVEFNTFQYAEIKQFSLASNTFTGPSVGVPPSGGVFDIGAAGVPGNGTVPPDSDVVFGEIAGQRGHSLAGTFYLSAYDSDTSGSGVLSGDHIVPWTASTLTAGTTIDLSTGWGGISVWVGVASTAPTGKRNAIAFYNDGGTIKYMFLPRGTGGSPGSLAGHFFITPLSSISVPTVTTQAETGIGTTTGTANGNITNLGGAPNCILEGFVFDTVTHSLPGNVAPGSSGYLHNVTSAGTFSTGPYSIGMTGLTAGTTYFVRAVAQNSAGYSYGNEISFTTVPILNNATVLLVSSKAPSSFEDEVTFTATVSDPIVGDPNPNTPPVGANSVQFVADGTFGFGTATPTPLSSTPHAISATATVATYIGANSFSAGQKVTITGFGGGFTQFNQTNVLIASAGANSFTVNGTYTTQSQVNQDGVATSTSASQATATTTVLIPGLHSIVAHYLGDPTLTTGHNPANSNALTQQVVNVPTNTTQELPGFGLIASFSTQGDNALPPQAQLFAIPVNASSHQSINLLWNTLNVAFIRITGNNGVDYQPSGFDTGFVSTSGSGIYVVGNGFTATITLTLQAYDQSQMAIAGLVSQVLIHIS